MTMSSVSCWINAVKEINASFNGFKYVGRSSNTHKVYRFILWKIWNCF